ncbi:hypothetical protein AOLI_G00155550 [Acnodon oligacanthus]
MVANNHNTRPRHLSLPSVILRFLISDSGVHLKQRCDRRYGHRAAHAAEVDVRKYPAIQPNLRDVASFMHES